MSTKRISLACTTVAFAALGWVAACSSNNNNNGGSSSNHSSSSNSGTTSNSASNTTSSGGSNTTATSSSGSGSLLIDDQSNPTGQIKVAVGAGQSAGYWFSTINDTGGSITPPPTPAGAASNWVFGTVTGPADASITSAACMRGVTSPQQYSEAGIGFNFAIEKIDAAADSGVQAPAVEYDISAHKGIQFWAFGAADAGTQSVRVLFPDHTTDPRGGVCPADASDMTQCYDSWQDTISISPGWQLVTIHYTPVAAGTSGDLTQLGFGFSEANGFDDAHVYGVTFQVNGPQTADAGTGTAFDLCFADLMFVDN